MHSLSKEAVENWMKN